LVRKYVLALALAVALAIAGGVVAAVADAAAFTGNACGLLTTQQVVAVNLPAKCHASLQSGTGYVAYFAIWSSSPSNGAAPALQVEIDRLSPSLLAVQKRKFARHPALYAAPAQKILGLSLAVYQQLPRSVTGPTITVGATEFFVGDYRCLLNLAYPYSAGGPSIPEKATAIRLTKIIAGEL
jgi:hypothetical protein